MSRETESNRRPKDVNQSPLQSSALPTELSRATWHVEYDWCALIWVNCNLGCNHGDTCDHRIFSTIQYEVSQGKTSQWVYVTKYRPKSNLLPNQLELNEAKIDFITCVVSTKESLLQKRKKGLSTAGCLSGWLPRPGIEPGTFRSSV